MKTQARIPISCCCIHNVIHTYDSTELADMELRPANPPDEPDMSIYGETAQGVPTIADCDLMARRWEGMAAAMWRNYAEERARRGNPVANIQGD